MSLERKLPLLMTALLASVLAVALFLTYRTLHSAAEFTPRERMLRAAQSIAGTVEAAIQDRAARLHALTTDTAFVAAVRRGDQRPLQALLQRLRGSNDSALAIEVWNTRHERTALAGATLTAAERGNAFPAWLDAAAARAQGGRVRG